jgi:mRNA interferase HigB
MHIIKTKTLKEFYLKHADAKNDIIAWIDIAQGAEWKSFGDLQQLFPYLSLLKNNRMVFNIGGNKYRLMVKFIFITKTVYIRFIGTRAEYDKINANTI